MTFGYVVLCCDCQHFLLIKVSLNLCRVTHRNKVPNSESHFTFSVATTLEYSPNKELISPAYFSGVFPPTETPVLGKSFHKRKSSGCASGLGSTEGGGGSCSVVCPQHPWRPWEMGGQLLATVL